MVGTERPIFVVGCARSGTTLLQLMLHAHPRIAVPPETRFLVESYDRRTEFGDLRDPVNRAELAAFMTRRKKRVTDLGLDRRRLRARLEVADPTIGSMAAEVFRAYAERFDKPRWGAKRPAYIERIGLLLRLFPDAQIVHIIRDGRDCVASLQGMPWWEHGAVGAVHKWVEAMSLAARARGRVDPDQFHELRYEDLVADPRDELQRLCTFLGEAFDEQMLEPHTLADRAVPGRKHWHERTHEPVDRRAVERWRSELSDDVLRLFEAVGWEWLEQHRYRPVHAHRPLPPASLYPAYLAYAGRRRLGSTRREVRDAARRHRGTGEVAARQT